MQMGFWKRVLYVTYLICLAGLVSFSEYLMAMCLCMYKVYLNEFAALGGFGFLVLRMEG